MKADQAEGRAIPETRRRFSRGGESSSTTALRLAPPSPQAIALAGQPSAPDGPAARDACGGATSLLERPRAVGPRFLRVRKISAAATDPDLSEMQSEQIEMDDPVVPPGASAMRRPGRRIRRGSPREGLLLRLEKALTQSASDRFRSAGGSELHKDVGDVPLRGALRNVQRGGQLLRRVSCRDVAKDLPLAV